MSTFRWKVVARDVNGDLIDTISVHGVRFFADRVRRQYERQIWEPVPGRPLYTVHVERTK